MFLLRNAGGLVLYQSRKVVISRVLETRLNSHEFSIISADSELHAVQIHQNLRCHFHLCPWLRCPGTGCFSPLVSLK